MPFLQTHNGFNSQKINRFALGMNLLIQTENTLSNNFFHSSRMIYDNKIIKKYN